MSDIFLSAEWRNIAMLNFEIDPAALKARVPAGTELDLWQGKALVSLVGFQFLNTRVKGFRIPFHTNFEELNLRFYVKRKHPKGDRRAVVFIKEIVPRWAIAFVAQKCYNENYAAMPMRHAVLDKSGVFAAHYGWNSSGRWQSLSITSNEQPAVPPKNSEQEFITEHYWGYAAQPDGSTLEYRVSHPQWRIRETQSYEFDADVKELYGNEFAPYLSKAPVSVFLADGSEVTVSKGVKI